MVLSAHNDEIFNGVVMTSGVVVVMDEWGGPHVVSEPFCKSSVWFSHVFFLTVHPIVFVSVNHPIILEDGVSVLRDYQEVLDGELTSSFFSLGWWTDDKTIELKYFWNKSTLRPFLVTSPNGNYLYIILVTKWFCVHNCMLHMDLSDIQGV